MTNLNRLAELKRYRIFRSPPYTDTSKRRKMHSPPTTTTTTTRQRHNSKSSTAARKTISLTHVARRSDNPYDVKRTVEKLRAQQQEQNPQTNTFVDVATSENSFAESLSPLSLSSSPTATNARIEPAAKVKILTNLLIDGSLGYSLAINYEDSELSGKKKINMKTDKPETLRNNMSDSIQNQNVSVPVGINMAPLLDPRPMARQYNAERSNANANYARQQQMPDHSLESQATFQPLFSYEEYRSTNGRDNSRTEASRAKTKPTPLPLPPIPPPTYNGDEQSLHKLLTAMPTVTSHRHEMSTRSRRLSCSGSNAMSLRSGLPQWRSAINNIIGVSEPVPTTSSHSFQPYKPPPQQMQSQLASNSATMSNMPSRPIPQQAGNLNQTSADLSARNARISPPAAVVQQPQPPTPTSRESAFVPPLRNNSQPARIRARRMTVAEPHPIRNANNIERLERAPTQRITPPSGNAQYDVPSPNYTSEADTYENSHAAPIYQTFVECRHLHEDMPPPQRALPYMVPNRRQYSHRSHQHTDWRSYPPVYYNNGGGGGAQHPMMWLNNNGPYQPHFRYNEPPPVYEESVPYGPPEPHRSFYYPPPEHINRPPPFIRHTTAPVFFYGYQQIARQHHASNAWTPRHPNAQFYSQEYH